MKKSILALTIIIALTVSGCANMNKTQKGSAWDEFCDPDSRVS